MTDFRINVVLVPPTGGHRKTKEQLSDLERAGDRLGRSIRTAFAFVGGALLVRELVELSDAYTNLQNRLRVVTDGEVELAEATADLLRISNDTRVSFTATAELYTRTSLAIRELGRSQKETLQFTESLNKAVILSGASAQEAQAGLVQLSQGLASGTLRGDELRSVLEQLPVVADVIAKQMGVTRGELRALGKEGEITAEVILDAFQSARRELDEKFKETIPTIGQAFTVLRNDLIALVGGFQDTSSGVAELVLILAEAVEGFDDLLGVLGEFASLGLPVKDSLHNIRLGLQEIDDAAQIIAESTATAGGSIDNLEETAERLRKVLSLDPDNELAQRKLAEVEERMKRIQVQSGLADEQVKNLTKTLERVEAALAADPSREDLAAKAELLRQKLGLVKEVIAQFPDLAAAVAPPEASEALQSILDALDREAELLQKTNAEREVANELAKIEKALAKEKVDLTEGERAALEVRLEEQRLLKEKAEILNEIRGPEEERAERERLVAQLLAEKNITEAESIKLLEEKKKAQDDLSAAEVIANLERDVELRKLSNEEQRVQNDLLQIQNALRRDGATLTPEELARVETLLRQGEAVSALRDLQDDLADSTLSAADIQAQFNAAMEDGVLTAEELAAVLQKIKERSDEASEVLPKQAKLTEEAFRNLATNGIDVAFKHLDEFLETGKFNFKDFAREIISESLKIIARLLLIQALEGAFGATGGAIGGSIDSGLNGLSTRAGGGRAQAGQDYIVGEEGPELFRPDSSGSILPADATAAALGAPSASPAVVTTPPPQVNVSVVNVTDPREALSALATPDGERVILNVLQKNRRGARQILS